MLPAVAGLPGSLGLCVALLACIVLPAQGTIFPPGPAGACPDTLVIRNVQDPASGCYPAIGDTVPGLRGIITGFDTKPSGFGFYFQNSFASGPLPWTGVFVLSFVVDFRNAPLNLAVGDSVALYGKTQDFQGETEIIPNNNSFSAPNLIVRKINSGNPLPPAKAGTTADFNWVPSISATTAEPWEGCLVRIYGPLVVARAQIGAGVPPSSFMIVNPNSPGDSVLIDGVTLTTVTPPLLGTGLSYVQGILNQRSTNGVASYRIQLRDSADISIEPPTPHNATATAQCGSVSVNWDTAPGASGYKVKRDGVVISGAAQIAGPPFVDTNPGVIQRCYTVCAVVLDSLDGECASAACATAPDVAPTVTDPIDRSLPVGASGGFSVFTTGAALTYVWRKDGVPVSGAPSSRTFVLTNIQPGDAGSYDVQVCNACGCDTSAVATLAVCPALTIAPLPALVRAIDGAPNAQISTTVSGAASMNWYRQGVPLSDDAKYSGTETSTLTVSNVAFGDAGFYQLRATPGCGVVGKSSNSCQLKVSACTTTLVIGTQPASQSVLIGSPATFSIFIPTCTTPNYQWQRYVTASKKWVSIAGATGSQYTIASVTAADAGTYRCIVTAPGATGGASKSATLNVVPPLFLTTTTTPLTCTSARVKWTTNAAMTVVVNYGTACASPSDATEASPLGTSGSADITLPNRSSAFFRLAGQTEQGQPVLSPCKPAYFRSAPAMLGVQVQGLPAYGDLYGTEDGIPIRIRLSNTGCVDIVGPIVLAQLTAAGQPPRNPDHSIALPRDLSITGLGAGESLVIDEVMFSRSEVGALPGAIVPVSGTIQYGTPARSVRVSASIRLP